MCAQVISQAMKSNTESLDQQFELDIIYSDEYFYCVNKPPGLPVTRTKDGSSSVLSLVYDEFGEGDLRAPHRIDQPTHGLQLVARSAEADRRLSELFRERKVQKEYWAAVEGDIPDEGVLEHWLVHDKRANKSRITQIKKDGKKAVLSYRKVRKTDRYSLVRVFPQTGRHHQIRAQLAAHGFPIKGDVKYGARRGNKDRSIHLLAHQLGFMHPFTDEPVSFTVNPIEDPIWSLWPQDS